MSTDSVSSATFVNESVNAENPWLGLHSFTEELQEFFYGRDGETDELARRVNRKTLTVLFGQSGLGKTSLLRAGLFPRLRRSRFLPFTVRIVHTEDAPPAAEQIIAAFVGAATSARAELHSMRPAAGTSLWEYFHHIDFELRSSEGKPLVPVAVFDQFEEVFTIGGETDALRSRGAALLTELADLVENRPPQTLVDRFETDPDQVEQFQFDRADYRVLISLREDYLANLEDLRPRMPSLSENRMRLARMNGEQALDAVSKPGGPLVTPQVSRQIVRFVSGAPAADEDRADVDLSQHEVDPAMLSLFCAELNNRRRAAGLPQITSDLLAGNRDTILRDYYERCLSDAHPEARRFVEDELLTDLGYRVDVPLEKANKNLSQKGAPADALDVLVKRRLLRTEERLHVRRVELTHDVLTSVVRQSRDERYRQEQAELSQQRELQIREKLRKARKRLLAIVSVMAAFLAFVSAFGLFSYVQWQKAVRAEQEARRQRDLAAAATEQAEANAALAKVNEALAKSNEALAKERADVAEKLQEMAREYIEESNYNFSQIANEFPSVRAVQLVILRNSLGRLERIIEVNPQAVWAQHNRSYMLAFACEAAQRLGKRDEALELARQAIAAASALPSDEKSPKVAALSLGITASSLRILGEYELAAKILEQGHAALETLKPEENADPARWKASLHQVQGELYRDLKQHDKRLQAYEAAIKLHNKWLEKSPKDDRLRNDLVTFQIEAGRALLSLGKTEEAIAKLEAAKDLRVKLWRESDSIKARNQVAYVCEQLGWAYRVAGNLKMARIAYQNMENARRGVIIQTPGVLPDDFAYDPEVGERNLSNALQQFGSMEYKIGDPKIGREKYEQAVKLARALRERVPDLENLSNLSGILVYWGDDLYARKEWEAAEKLFLEALQLRETVLEKRPDDATAKGEVAFILDKIADCNFSQERWADAASRTAERARLRREAHDAAPTPTTLERLVAALGSHSFHSLFVKKPEQAQQAAEEALKLKPDETWIRTNLAHALLFLDRYEEAEAIYREYANVNLGTSTFADECRNDFRLLRQAGVDHPRFADIEALLPAPAEATKDDETSVDDAPEDSAEPAAPTESPDGATQTPAER